MNSEVGEGAGLTYWLDWLPLVGQQGSSLVGRCSANFLAGWCSARVCRKRMTEAAAPCRSLPTAGPGPGITLTAAGAEEPAKLLPGCARDRVEGGSRSQKPPLTGDPSMPLEGTWEQRVAGTETRAWG